jgi:hypothetical protein
VWKSGGELRYRLQQILNLLNTFSLKNSIELTQELDKLNIDHNTQFCSFDFTNMFTNIPKQDTINIIKDISHNEQYPDLYIQTMIRILTTILDQDFFQFNNKIYQQKEGLPMGAPFSPILAETYIQNIEHNIIIKKLQNYKIFGCYRYVDDILLVYNKLLTSTVHLRNLMK